MPAAEQNRTTMYYATGDNVNLPDCQPFFRRGTIAKGEDLRVEVVLLNLLILLVTKQQQTYSDVKSYCHYKKHKQYDRRSS